MTIQAADIRSEAARLGFDHVRFASAEPAREDGKNLEAWCAEGKAAGMGWLARDAGRRAVPQVLLPRAASLITLGVSYFQGPVPAAPAAPAGRIARYAWGEDYHAAIERRLEAFRVLLPRIFGREVETRPTFDMQAFLERAFARRSGIGFVGKNTNVIAPGAGSYLFLANLLIDSELPPDPPVPQGCGGCTACQTACPTGALSTDFSLDARLCVAYHTIENRGSIPRELRSGLKNWLFGCDDCQDACPYNARAKETQWPEFRAERGPGPWITLADILVLRTNESFKAKFAGTSLLRAKRAGLVRNACVVAANQGADSLAELLIQCLREDTEPWVRSHAGWALVRLGHRGALGDYISREPDPAARQEMAELL